MTSLLQVRSAIHQASTGVLLEYHRTGRLRLNEKRVPAVILAMIRAELFNRGKLPPETPIVEGL